MRITAKRLLPVWPVMLTRLVFREESALPALIARIAVLSLTAVTAAVVPLTATTGASAATRGIDAQAAPTYVGWWDTTQWNTFLNSTGRLPRTVIINSNNGTDALVPQYQSLIHRLHGRGIHVLGYVDTSFTKVSLIAAKASVGNYFPAGAVPGDTTVDGIFLDQFSSYTNRGQHEAPTA